jgi:hypothetical protein
MISGGQIAQGAITDNKVGKNANIKHSKLDKANEGEVLVAQGDGRLKAVRISGDARMSTTGRLTVTSPEVDIPDVSEIDKRFLRKTDLKEGKTLVGGPTKPEEVPVGSGANAIPQRDSSGNLKAETADQATTATNADKLDDQEGSYYTDVDNHTYPEATTTTVDSNETTTTKRVHEVVEFVPSSAYGSTNYPITFEHLMPYIPDVSVFILESNEYHEVDAKVKATAADGNTAGTVSVDVSETGLNLKVIAS